MSSESKSSFGTLDVTFGILLAFMIRGCVREVGETIGEQNRIRVIESETGCKVKRWSPGQQRNCTPFNISNQEDNVTAWLCCP